MGHRVSTILEKILERQPQSLRGQEKLRGLNLDSLDIVTLIADIDTAYGFTISPAQFDTCATIDDLQALVEKERPGRASAA